MTETSVADAGNFEDVSMPPAAPTAAPRPDTTRGYSPARDSREAMQAREPEKFKAADGSDRFKFGDVELSDTEIKDLMKLHGEQIVRKASIPPSPDKYEIALPADFKAPGDAKFEFNKDDPGLKQLRELAHKRGWDQAKLSDTLGLYASNKISEQIIYDRARNAELGKLGSMAPQRIDAVRMWAHGTLGRDLGGAIDQMLVTAKHVEAFEKIIGNASRQGGTQFVQNGRDTEQASAGSIPGYDKMTFAQRRAAQMQHAGVVNRRGTT